MAKILIELPEEIYILTQKFHCHGTVAEKKIWDAIKNGTRLDTKSNGGVVETLFPKVQDVDKDWFGEEWWDATFDSKGNTENDIFVH